MPVVRRLSDGHVETLRRFARRGSRAKVSKLLARMRPGDVAETLRGLTPAEQIELFRILLSEFPDGAAEVLSELDAAQRLGIIEHFGAEEIARILEHMAVDDTVFVLDSLPEDLRDEVLDLVEEATLSEVESQLTYRDDSAGRIMTTEYFALPETTSVRDAIAAIQEQDDVEMIFYLYVVDEDGGLAGVVSLRQLLLARPQRTLAEVMTTNVVSVNTETDQEEVARLAERYDLLAVPVLDTERLLAGIVTYDDIVDVVKEEANEDFFKMAGTSDEEVTYQETSWRVAKIRLPWLLVNLVGSVLTGLLLAHFQVSFHQVLFLLTFVPVIMGTGGNTGAQSATLAVRGLATGRLVPELGRVRHFLWQQAKVGAYLGVGLGAIVALVAFALEKSPAYALVVGVALFGAIVVASLNGALIPLVFQRLGIDPAVASGPLVTTGSDITGILIYFGLASVMMKWLVG